jgi:broad specificity phosphatase PhoE
MTRVMLIRHGAHDLLDRKLAGRMPDVLLNEQGRVQAEGLAEILAGRGIDAIVTSPIDRALETARPIAARLDLPLGIDTDLTEIDFGTWTGLSFPELSPLDDWQRFNTFRSGTRAPGGESIIEVQARMIGAIERMARDYPDGQVVLVGHGDPIKLALAFYVGIPIDLCRRVDIRPASISLLEVTPWQPRLLALNWAPDVPL